MEEVLAQFDFLAAVYGKFGYTFKLKLSTRPEGHLGEIETWDKAEDMLKGALDKFAEKTGGKWELNPGDGAFYGPKIDITISDALKREFQCATVQLDFQLPIRFGLEYMTSEVATKPKEEAPKEKAEGEATPAAPSTAKVTPGYARPVMIHRAIYGSFERFIA
jgi:threonyl-tRNA synthetase